jgi:ribose transport system substrate-binding protein
VVSSPHITRVTRSFVIVTLALGLAACSSQAATQAPVTAAPVTQAPVTAAPATAAPVTAAPASQQAYNIAFIAGQVGIPFYTTMQCGAQDAAKKYGVNLTWQGPSQWDLSLQMPMINAALQRHPDAMALAPTDPVALIKTVQDAGIPVVTVDGNLSQPVDIQNIRTDNKAAGGLAADALGAAIGGAGSVLVLALSPGVSANQDRVDGFVTEMKAKYPNVTVLPTQYAGTDQRKAADITAATIQSKSDLKGIYTTNGDTAVGASGAVIAASKQGKIKIVAYDANPQQVRDLKAGIYDGLVVQAPYLEGYDAVELLVQVLNKSVDPASLPDVKYPPMIVATRDNLDTPEVQKYLYVDSCS